ncbi:MAG: glutathione S-transferase N-terminal domain-containing protein [Gammaproteobacteria bacterium]|nr:glutathione S-transferase N-terminal domain-containing protein [Gammaproteobacteria bacterium]
MKLYGTLTSPYVRKVRAFLHEKGIAHEFIIEAPGDAAGNVSRLNPLGKVPVLLRDDGEALFDSPVIIDYLDGLQGAPLMPPVGDARFHAQRWHALAQGICDAVVTRLMETRRRPELQDPAVIAKQEGKVAGALRFAEAHLGNGSTLAGERFGIADIALAVALEYIDLRHPHDWRSGHPALARWLTGVAEHPCLKKTRAPT